MSEQHTLKPCPFCNVDCTEMNYNGVVYFVSCGNCGAHGPHGITETIAIKAWNDRAAVSSEREACAKVCHEYAERVRKNTSSPHKNVMIAAKDVYESIADSAQELEQAIRARAEAK